MRRLFSFNIMSPKCFTKLCCMYNLFSGSGALKLHCPKKAKRIEKHDTQQAYLSLTLFYDGVLVFRLKPFLQQINTELVCIYRANFTIGLGAWMYTEVSSSGNAGRENKSLLPVRVVSGSKFNNISQIPFFFSTTGFPFNCSYFVLAS